MNTHIEINLDILEKNTLEIINKVGKDKIIAVLKANAYGLGYKIIFERLKKLGINYFAVGTFNEAIKLYELDKKTNILILCPIEKNEYEKIKKTNIEITITNEKDLEYIESIGLKNKIHIKFDTGMNRLGFRNDEIYLIDKYLDNKKLNIYAIFTHLSSAISNDEYTKKQIEMFNKYTKKYDLKKHILNSDGFTKYYNKKEIVLDYVRLGIALFENVMSLYSKILQIDNNVGIIEVGYVDGYARKNEVVYIKNKKYMIKEVHMNYTTILIDENVKVGDKVELYGQNLKISEEYMTGLSNRIEKIYIERK
ncbi:alanine racemase [Oceanivirga salmonicida]|uniref:alanine racemase n=1 Tax=Oceanivirga salmonicida TaxID=1769291 RepID=UPI000A4B9A03|nr:alanine racemase [Oceanivirga salmonicida]